MDVHEKLTEKLQEVFGFSTFRAGQEEIVSSVVEGRHTLAVMPTGAGKSLCYQLPACMFEGLTVVVSPLIALMKDQVDAAQARGIPAVAIHSAMSWPEQQEALTALTSGALKIVYIAPERFRNETFRRALEQVKISLLAIDEAHCISQWGHDFRPDYLDIGEFRKALGDPVTMALTATATPEVQGDILKQLSIKNARVIVSGFERPNLFFEVLEVDSDEEKFVRMERILEQHAEDTVVIYCATRKQVDLVRARLSQQGLLVGAYHAGMPDARRVDVQEAFMTGDVPILVATNAFGMGVDKSDVRAIIHFNIPGSVEAYYQEAGRAGRDNKPARCTLLYSSRDRGVHEFFIELSFPSPDIVLSVWSEIRRYGLGTHAIGAETIARHLSRSSGRSQVSAGGVEAAMRLLKQSLHIDFGVRDGFPWVACLDLARGRDLRIDWDQVRLRRDIAHRQLRDMTRFCETQDCRQLNLLRYFKSTSSFGKQCGRCDRCVGPLKFAPQRVEVPEPLHIVVAKTLSGVARTNRRVNAGLIAGMLRGSESKLLQQRGLDKLSTYGVLRFMSASEVHKLFEILQTHQLIVRGSRDELALTDTGIAVMRSEVPLPEGLRIRLSQRWSQEETMS